MQEQNFHPEFIIMIISKNFSFKSNSKMQTERKTEFYISLPRKNMFHTIRRQCGMPKDIFDAKYVNKRNAMYHMKCILSGSIKRAFL